MNDAGSQPAPGHVMARRYRASMLAVSIKLIFRRFAASVDPSWPELVGDCLQRPQCARVSSPARSGSAK